MTDMVDNDLDRMFGDFSSRKETERLANEQRDVEHQQFRESAISILEEHVLPILRDLAEKLKSRGHDADVIASNEIQSYPSASLTFRVIQTNERPSYAPPSRIFFETTTSQDRLMVRRSVWSSEREEGTTTFRLLNEVQSDWVWTQALSFVERVLDKQ